MELVVLALLAVVAALSAHAYRGRRSEEALRAELDASRARLKPVANIGAELARVAAERDKADAERRGLQAKIEQQRKEWDAEFTTTVSELEKIRYELSLAQSDYEIASHGLYSPQFTYSDSEEYKQAITTVRAEQKAYLAAGALAICDREWTVDGNKVEGKKMTNRNLKLMVRAFNGEADASIATVTHSNLKNREERLSAAFEAINRLGEPNACSLTQRFLTLKLKELYLNHESKLKQEEEREERRAIREHMREEARVQKEIEKALQDAERDEKTNQAALDKARSELAEANDRQRTTLERKIAELERRLEEAAANKERAISRAQLTKSGHVYIISNHGSFGDRIHKIGMTRRLDPFERVMELGDASVPFPFDVHAMVYSENAPELEYRLHRTFADRRLNLVNERREYFHVSLEEIEAEIRKVDPGASFSPMAEAYQFRQSEAVRKARIEKDQATADRLLSDARVKLDRLRARWGTADGKDEDGGEEEPGA